MPLEALCNAARLVAGVVDGVEHGDRPPEVRLARPGQLHPASTPGQQADPEFALQLPDLLRQWRLGDVQPFGRPPEVQFLGDRPEVAEVPQLHD